ncbi:MAG: zinc ribbon domain-containing protein [Gammaproteobacteria bacterium]|nr:zinc ribbon domain-containing protein [Gammaproteobacteria bacterium]
MPIYEYVCSDCGHEFEKLQKMSDAPLSDCPACEMQSLKKKISAPGFRLSGSGWYETDFKSDKQKNLSKGDSTDKDSTAKSEKPAASKSAKSATTKGASNKEAAA